MNIGPELQAYIENPYTKLDVSDSEISISEPATDDSHTTRMELEELEQIIQEAKLPREIIRVADRDPLRLFYSVAKKKGLDPLEEEAKEWADDWTKLSFEFKLKFKRRRPWEVKKEHDIDFVVNKSDTTESPSYPSGHAMMGYGVAEFYKDKYPLMADEWDNVAEIIAHSRLQMGVHYPSDVEASKKIVEQLVGDGVKTASLLDIDELLSEDGPLTKVASYANFLTRLSPEAKAAFRQFRGRGKSQTGWIKDFNRWVEETGQDVKQVFTNQRDSRRYSSMNSSAYQDYVNYTTQNRGATYGDWRMAGGSRGGAPLTPAQVTRNKPTGYTPPQVKSTTNTAPKSPVRISSSNKAPGEGVSNISQPVPKVSPEAPSATAPATPKTWGQTVTGWGSSVGNFASQNPMQATAIAGATGVGGFMGAKKMMQPKPTNSMPKLGSLGHLEQRRSERAKFMSKEDLASLEKKVRRTKDLPEGANYITLPHGRKGIVRTEEGKSHLATILDARMRPPGRDLTNIINSTSGHSKEARALVSRLANMARFTPTGAALETHGTRAANRLYQNLQVGKRIAGKANAKLRQAYYSPEFLNTNLAIQRNVNPATVADDIGNAINFFKISSQKTAAEKLRLYHGSPHDLETLEPRQPNKGRWGDHGLYGTTDPLVAALYAIARNDSRGSWGVLPDGRLIAKSKKELNPEGYVYGYDSDDYIPPPEDDPGIGYASQSSPDILSKEKVYLDQLRDSITRVDDRDKFLEYFKKTSSPRLRTTIFGVDPEGNLLHGFGGQGFYKFPGGGVDTGESIVDAAKRELLEEAGYDVESIEELQGLDTSDSVGATSAKGHMGHGSSLTKYLLARLGKRNESLLGSEGDAISNLQTAPIDEVLGGLEGDMLFGSGVAESNHAALSRVHDMLQKTSSEQPLFRHRSTLLIRDPETGKLLAAKTPEGELSSPFYFPGGGLYDDEYATPRNPSDEDIIEGARREALEELGIQLDNPRVVGSHAQELEDWWKEKVIKTRGVPYLGGHEHYVLADKGKEDRSLYNVEGDAFEQGDYYDPKEIVEALSRAAKSDSTFAPFNREQVRTIKDNLLKKNASDLSVLTAVPTQNLDMIMRKGLYSQKAMLDDPEVLSAFLAQRNADKAWKNDEQYDEKRFREQYDKRVELMEGDDAPLAGPSVFFTDPDPDKVSDPRHFVNKFDTQKLRVNLGKLLADIPETRITGAELIPSSAAENMLDEEFEQYVKDRRRDITPEEAAKYIATDPKELWKHYKDEYLGRYYAADVPHAFIRTPSGIIPPEYLEQVEKTSSAKEQPLLRHRATLLIRDPETGKILAANKSDDPRFEGISPYHFPGGGLYSDEYSTPRTPTEEEIIAGARREALEELGIALNNAKVVGSTDLLLPEYKEKALSVRGAPYIGKHEHYVLADKGKADSSLYNVEGDAFTKGDYYDPQTLYESLVRYGRGDNSHAPLNAGQARAIKEHLLSKTSSAKEQLKHILVTGHSGAGKSTYARQLAEELGMPLHELDSRAKEILSQDYPEHEGLGWPGDLSERVVREALALDTPHVIEGTQIHDVPDLGADLRRILVDTPEDRVVEQRAAREYEKRKVKNKPYRPMEGHRDAARKLVDYYRESIDNFRGLPGVESIVPEVKQAALEDEFQPDLTPDDLKALGVYDQVYGDAPSEASMKEWPEHWINKQDPLGWLQWYDRYSGGRRTDDDERQMKRWKSFKARHLAQYLKKPTPRRAAALRNWGIDVGEY